MLARPESLLLFALVLSISVIAVELLLLRLGASKRRELPARAVETRARPAAARHRQARVYF